MVAESFAIDYYRKQLLIRVLSAWIKFKVQEVRFVSEKDQLAHDFYNFARYSRAIQLFKSHRHGQSLIRYNTHLSIVFSRLSYGRYLLSALQQLVQRSHRFAHITSTIHQHGVRNRYLQQALVFISTLQHSVRMKRRHTQQLLRSTYINTYAIFPALRQHAIQRTYHTQQEHMTYTHCLRSMLRRGVRYWAGRVRRRRHHEVCEHQCARYATNSLLSLVLRRLQSRVQNKRRQLVVFERCEQLSRRSKESRCISLWLGYLAERSFNGTRDRRCAAHHVRSACRRIMLRLVQLVKLRYARRREALGLRAFQLAFLHPIHRRRALRTWKQFSCESRLQYDLEHRGHAHYLRRLLAKGLGRLHTHTHRLHTQRHMGSRGRLAYHTKACTQAVGQWLNVVREVTLRSRQHIYAAVSLYRIYRYLAAYTAWRGYAQHQKDKRMRMYEARAVRRSLVVRDVCSRVMRYAAHIHPDTIRRRYLAKKYTTIWRHLAGKRAKQAARQRPVTRPSSGSSIVADSRVGVSGGRDRSMDDEKEHVRIYSKAPPRLTGFLEVIERAEQLYCNDEKDTEESLSDIPAPSHSLPPIVQHYVDVAEAKVDLARAPPKQSLLVLGAEADKQDNLEVLLAVGGDAKETKRQLRKQLAHEILKFVYEYKDVLIMEA